MRTYFLLCMALLMTGPDALFAQNPAPSPASGVPRFVQTLHDPNDLAGKMLPGPLVRDLKKQGLDLKSLHAPVLLSFWSTWCENCTMALRDAEQVSSSGLIASIAIDYDRDPNAATAYLASHHIAVRNLHDDGTIRRSVVTDLYTPPYPRSILLNADGRVIFTQRSIYRKELLAAIGSLGPAFAQLAKTMSDPKTETMGELTAEGARKAARAAMDHEADYLGAQRDFACQYEVKTLCQYDSARAEAAVMHLEEVLATDKPLMETRIVDKDRSNQCGPVTALAADSYRIWNNPLLQSVLAHSLISNVQPSVVHRLDGAEERFVYFTFRGDPAFTPVTDVDRVAQALVGWIRIQLSENVLLMVSADTEYDVTNGNRFFVARGIPLLDFRAVPYDKTYIPSVWSEQTFGTVVNDSDAHMKWRQTLVRTFGIRQRCKEFKVKSTILPGFGIATDHPK
jgi:thiol-disulfide isomerase/thioredoxin